MNPFKILGILIDDNISKIDSLQYTLTKFGNVIRTRIGLNNVDEFDNKRRSIIILELFGDNQEMSKLEQALTEINGLQIQEMNFST
ncbi:hypothetical protein ACFLRZ_00660 [Bacteroidota bacterium]